MFLDFSSLSGHTKWVHHMLSCATPLSEVLWVKSQCERSDLFGTITIINF